MVQVTNYLARTQTILYPQSGQLSLHFPHVFKSGIFYFPSTDGLAALCILKAVRWTCCGPNI